MKHIAQSLALGLAVLAVTAASPKAADWSVGSNGAIKDFGSIKDYRNAAVPVPAPTPSPSFAKDYYIRGDLGFNLATSANVTTTGGITARGDDELNNFLFGSIGAGRYITPSLRGEITFDFRPKKTVTTGPQTYYRTVTTKGISPVGNPSVDTLTYAVNATDDSSVADQTAFFNLYYDFNRNRASRFTPYIGAGIGIDLRRYKRVSSQLAMCQNGTSLDTVTNIATTYANFCPASGPANSAFSGDKYTSAFGFAAAAMVGVAYEVMPGVQLDVGYRAVWEGAELSVGSASIDGSTTIKLGSRIDQELRTGLRVDLY
jgi:opacity protein-like surface antigen